MKDGMSTLSNTKAKETMDLDIKVNFVQFSVAKLSQLQLATNVQTKGHDSN